MKHVLLSLLVAMMLTASAVSADDAKHEFRVRLDRIEEPILAGDYEKARTKAVQLEQDMVHRILAGPKVREYLGSIATLHAISLAGVGELDHAAWKWAMAREIQPATDLGTLERFGSVGPRGHEISILTLLPARHRHGSGVGHGRDRR